MASVHVIADDRAGPVVVRMAGAFDMANADDVRATLLGLDGERAVVLDLAETSYIDSSVLAVCAELVRRGTRLRVENPQPMVAQVLRLSGIERQVA